MMLYWSATLEEAPRYDLKNDMNVSVVVDTDPVQDVNVLQLMSLRGEPTQLQQLSWVEGRSIGSALIDINFHHIVSDRLNKIRDYLQGEPDDIAEKMMKGRFERFKCSYGTAASSAIPTIPLEVPGLRAGKHFPNVNIEDSTMRITRYASSVTDENKARNNLNPCKGRVEEIV